MKSLNDWRRSYQDSWREKPLLNILGLTFAISLLFSFFPALDLGFSRLFYEDGKGFPARTIELLRTIRAIGQYFPMTFAIVVVIALVLKLIYPSRRCLFPARFTVYFASLFLLGPGLLVNVILKPFWDRPRPVNTIDFGGLQHFISAWTMGGAVFANRSFVSGEAAGVVCLLPLALFVPAEWRRSVMGLLTAFAIAISFNRIAFGAHFLSDVLIATGLVLALAIGLWKLIYENPSNRFSEEALEATLARAGFRIQHVCRSAGRSIVETIRNLLSRFSPLRTP